MTERALDLLRRQPHLAELAAYPFAFDLRRADHVEEVRLASGAPLEPIAGDDTGATYFVCRDGAVLYASSDGMAGLVGDGVDEALDVLTGLPNWQNYVGLSPDDGEERILAEVEDTESWIRETYGPELDADRAHLRTALGLPERSPVELVTLLYDALLRTEPDHLLLNAGEGLAYQPLAPHASTPLRDVVLATGRTDLDVMRADRTAWGEVTSDPVRVATVLRAAQYDRRLGDLPLLRCLLRHQAAIAGTHVGGGEELRLAAFLVARHGLAEDLPLLHAAREASAYTLPELLPQPAAATGWAHAPDDDRFGQETANEPEFTWTGLGRRQGRTEHVRVALIRMLDDTGPDAERLGALSHELELLGDFGQAARAQRNAVSLQGTRWDRAAAGHTLARLERRSGDLTAAWRALGRVRVALGLDAPATAADEPVADTTTAQWHRRGLGRMIAEEHLRLVLGAVESGDADLTRQAMACSKTLLKLIGEESRKRISPLSTEAKWAVARLKK